MQGRGIAKKAVEGVRRAALAGFLLAFSLSAYATDDCRDFYDNPNAMPRLMRYHDQIRNRNADGQPLIPAYAEATALAQRHRWADVLPLLIAASHTQPPPDSSDQQREAVYVVEEDSRTLADQVTSCTWMMPNGNAEAEKGKR